MFRCKQFVIDDSNCAMKVSTDSLILGSWCAPEKARHILDIGCGSGILSLMMLQKSHAFVHGIDIDYQAVQQARGNIQSCPWANRATIFHGNVHSLAAKQYDLIIANPPYFQDFIDESSITLSKTRRNARHQHTLDVSGLFGCAQRLSKTSARLVTMYPFRCYKTISAEAKSQQWNLSKLQHVRHTHDSAAYLTLFEFVKTPVSQVYAMQDLIIRKANAYTDQYKRLCCDFYLRF